MGRNFAEWDPDVTTAELVEGDGPGLDSAFDVTVKSPGRGCGPAVREGTRPAHKIP